MFSRVETPGGADTLLACNACGCRNQVFGSDASIDFHFLDKSFK